MAFPKNVAEGDDKDLKYWIERKEKELAAGQVDEKYIDYAKGWVASAKAELIRRAGGGKANGAAKSNGSSKAAAQPPRDEAPSASLVTTRPTELLGGFAIANATAIAEKLREYGEKYNLLSPVSQCSMLPDLCSVEFNFLKVDTTKSGNKFLAKEVHSLQGGDLGLTAVTLRRIASFAKIDWLPSGIHEIPGVGRIMGSRRIDDGSIQRFGRFEAVGKVRRFDLSWRIIVGTKELDLRGIDAGDAVDGETYSRMKARASDTANFESQMRDMRLFLNEHLETKARNRAIVDYIGKRSFTPAELDKPFVVASLALSGETDNPEHKKLYVERVLDSMFGAKVALYGQHQASEPAAPASAPAFRPTYSIPALQAGGDDDGDFEPHGGTDGQKTEGAAQPDKGAAPAGTSAASPGGAAPSGSTADPKGQQPLSGLPPDEDRGADPNQY